MNTDERRHPDSPQTMFRPQRVAPLLLRGNMANAPSFLTIQLNPLFSALPSRPLIPHTHSLLLARLKLLWFHPARIFSIFLFLVPFSASLIALPVYHNFSRSYELHAESYPCINVHTTRPTMVPRLFLGVNLALRSGLAVDADAVQQLFQQQL